MSHTLAQRHVDVGDEAAGHGVDRRVETRQRGGQQADDHNAPHARRDRAADVLREEPFTTAQDNLEVHVYLMIWETRGRDRKVRIETIEQGKEGSTW